MSMIPLNTSEVSNRVSLGKLLSVLGIESDSNIPVTGLAEDSRKIEGQNLFIAYPGENHDGRNYLQQADQSKNGGTKK